MLPWMTIVEVSTVFELQIKNLSFAPSVKKQKYVL